MASTPPNAQQEPQQPWSMIGPTHPGHAVRESKPAAAAPAYSAATSASLRAWLRSSKGETCDRSVPMNPLSWSSDASLNLPLWPAFQVEAGLLLIWWVLGGGR
jgi:hypothetical protein